MHDTYIVHNTGYGHMGVLASRADERHGYTLPKVCTELLVVKDKVRRPQVRPQVSLGQVHGM